MVYVAATATLLKARFPAFAAVDDAVAEAAIVRARRSIDDTWLEEDRQEAEMLLAGHELTLDGHGTGTAATMAARGLAGFKRFKSGQLEMEREAGTSGVGFSSTTYGARYLALLRRNVPPVAVTT